MANTGKKNMNSKNVFLQGLQSNNAFNAPKNAADPAAGIQGKAAKPGSVKGHPDPTGDAVEERWSD
ncbi:hypothetical protein [Clostridium oryzae]|uniref:Uncharacterized protein n=1 Tax=Clostridium oryzae TaxID=1450648 RepID=A0A1V4ITE9_9CLOT|nr:hypothetical protein [Clostridium oryzae]OPJ63090.1 hypothetical protein CLORY_14560 [Clostridium oryzae]